MPENGRRRPIIQIAGKGIHRGHERYGKQTRPHAVPVGVHTRNAGSRQVVARLRLAELASLVRASNWLAFQATAPRVKLRESLALRRFEAPVKHERIFFGGENQFVLADYLARQPHVPRSIVAFQDVTVGQVHG